VAWHELYDDPFSVLSARLRLVQAQLADALDHAPAGPVRLLSLCARQGRDVTSVLPTHLRRDDMSAVLIEANAENAETVPPPSWYPPGPALLASARGRPPGIRQGPPSWHPPGAALLVSAWPLP
jgi:hypothetical protein